MKDNPLMKYSEQLAVQIERLCGNIAHNSNTVFQIKKSSSSVFANISEPNTLKVCPICFQNSRSLVRSALKQKVG